MYDYYVIISYRAWFFALNASSNNPISELNNQAVFIPSNSVYQLMSLVDETFIYTFLRTLSSN